MILKASDPVKLGRLLACAFETDSRTSVSSAIAWHERAAKLGNAESQYWLAKIYIEGRHISVNPELGLFWLRESSRNGFALAQNDLGGVYQYGCLGLAPDLDAAIYLYELAAKSELPQAINNIGMLHYLGTGKVQNIPKSMSCFEKAAELGLLEAQRNLAALYLTGEAGETNHMRALYWLTRASRQGCQESQLRLSQLYLSGKGVPHDQDAATYWYTNSHTPVSL